MITQGSDALSRGVWVTPFQSIEDQRALTASVFAPLVPDEQLVASYIRRFDLPPDPTLVPWNSEGVGSHLLDRFSVWFPPPELARQAITFVLGTWVERPLTTSALFFVPRVVPAFWFGLSRHLRELPMVHPRETDLAIQPALPIPIVVLYLAPHVRSLPAPDRVVPSSKPKGLKWHREQAELLRRLPPSTLPR